ncbi:hypothetical protein WJX72_001944 [[Myrmecia] bisecta]|uniref:Gamma-tubulin complex component n=1 Tax=[Myrmecia] bisecta TaxID=41462 RepID=A0AAW1P6L8_9CHLO
MLAAVCDSIALSYQQAVARAKPCLTCKRGPKHAPGSRLERQLLLRLCELGWLFKKVQQHTHGWYDKTAEGTIRQAFGSALQRELADFYRLLATLEMQAKQAPARPRQPGGADGAVYLTLRRLTVWLAEPLLRMRWLALMADHVADVKGGALVRAIDSLAQHGDPFVRACVTRVLHHVCAPLLDMIRKWLFDGRLENAPGEFFISAHPSDSGTGGALWRSRYWLEAGMMPPFISPDLARQILRTGKSINFLRDCCMDAEWMQSSTRTNLAAAATQLTYGQAGALERVVQETSSSIDRHVIDIMMNKYRFVLHCDAIKRYLLLGQGDFIQALMDLVGPDLNKRAADISEYSLNGSLDAAVRASSAQYDEADILDRLHVKLDRHAASETGWDVFTLRYEVAEPLATVLPASAMTSYLRVFRLLWGLKRVEHTLARTWHLLNAMQRQLAVLNTLQRKHGIACPGSDAVWVELRHCHSIRNEMAHFCANLQNYIMLEVLEAAWTTFMSKLASVNDLDDLIAAHTDYLATLLRQSLLDSACAPGHPDSKTDVLKELHILLRIILDLLGPITRLHEAVELATSEVRTRARLQEERTAVGAWGSRAADKRPEGISADNLQDTRSSLQRITREYSQHQRLFMQLLLSQPHVDVRFLMFRLEAFQAK